MGSRHELANIYVAIASYRDPFLISTVYDALIKADNNNRITIGCFIQAWPKEHPITLPQTFDKRVKFEVIDPGIVFSVTECRSKAMQFLTSEHDYVLQIDSHTKFAQGWDTNLIKQIESLPKKSILSAYAPSWTPAVVYGAEHLESRIGIWECVFDDYSKDTYNNFGDITPALQQISTEENVYKGYYLCGHFIFAKSEFFLQYKPQKWIMFWGEELMNSLYAASAGWGVYIPNYVPVNHLYPQHVNKCAISPKIFVDYNDIYNKKSLETVNKIIDMMCGIQKPEGFTKEGLEIINNHLGVNLGDMYYKWRSEKRVH